MTAKDYQRRRDFHQRPAGLEALNLRRLAGWVNWRTGYASAKMDLSEVGYWSEDCDRALMLERAEDGLRLYLEIQQRLAPSLPMREVWHKLHREARTLNEYGKPALGDPIRALVWIVCWC